MHLTWRSALLAAVAGGALLAAPGVRAADLETLVTMVPMREALVNGDVEKFRAHHWMKEGYAGGLKDFSTRYEFPDGTQFSGEGHALIDQNDLGVDLSLKRDDLGFLNFDYTEFRKYYDGSGGVHRRFSTFQTVDTDKELALDIGNFGVETGLTLEGWPALAFLYEREFKDGAKSRLNWTPIKESGETRNIGPTWQDLDEIVDSLTLKANHELAGFALTGEQRWEFMRTETFREERSFSDASGGAADNKIRRQDQAPEADLMTTTLGAERWLFGDKAMVSTAYRFAKMKNREFETIVESDASGVVTNFTNPKQIRNARADNDYDTHTWVGSVMAGPWQGFSLGTKLKSEIFERDSNSSYPRDDDTGAPDGIINGTDVSLNNVKAVRWGEGFSVRFTGIPRSALYTELELEQARVLLREDRQSLDGPDSGNGSSAGEIFSRETVTAVRRGTWTLGGRVDPWAFLDLTAHVRHRVDDNDYDDQRESVAANTALSAFIDAQNIYTNEFTTRLTWKPARWFRSSVRYQFRDDDYSTRFEAQDTVKTGTRSHIYTYDVTLQPVRELLATASFSRQNAVTETPARLNSSVNIPAFQADVNTWLFSAEYLPTHALTWTGTLQYSRANNFNDFAETGLPLGADFHRLDLTTGLTWAVAEQTSLNAQYAFYGYNPNDNVESGDYGAHVIWLEISQTF